MAFVVQITFAQQQSVSGTVTDESGLPLPGATVIIKGTSTGVSTDFDGNYSIGASAGQILVFSYVGYGSKEVSVGTSKVVNVALQPDNTLEEVVVTALGIKRNAKEVPYAVTTLKSDDVTETPAVNVATAMVGKVAGLQINTTSNGVNPDTRVVLRGNRSLLGNNQALIVIDGFPSSRGVLDRINPNDIENISVLKGANAAALYGSDATNGVVMITTKKGKGKLSVSYSGSVLVENVAYLPEVQDQFGVGGFPDGTLWPLENVAWGPRFDGRMVEASETLDNGEVWMVPFSPIKDNYKDFFKTGYTTRHGVTVSGGDESGDFLMSIDQTNTTGIVPNDQYNRTNFRMKGSRTYERLTVGANLSFFRAHSNTVSEEAGRQGRPLYWNVINTPLHIPIGEMKNWRTGKFTRNETSYYAFYENPYFIADTQRQKNDYNDFNVLANIDYRLTDWLTASLNVGYTFSSQNRRREHGAFSYAFELENTYSRIDPYGANVRDEMENSSRFNSDFMLRLDKNLTEDINLKVTLGQNVRIHDSKRMRMAGDNLIIPDFYNVSTRTGLLTLSDEYSSDYRRVSFYGEATVGYKDFLYLTGTGRNDISSTLPKDGNSFFYYSGGLSFVPTSAFPGLISDRGLNYWKVSASYAKTGNDPGLYQTQGTFSAPDNFPYGNTVGLSQSNRVAAPNLNPEFTTSIEVGMELSFFRSRLRADLAAFKTNSVDQIIPVNVSYASGATSAWVNVGEIENKGVEVGLNGTIIKANDFSWDLGVNWSPLKTEVISLKDGVDELDLGGYSNAQIIAKVGQPYPQIKTTSYQRDPEGRVIVGANGNPLQDSNNQIQGKTTPDYIVGLNTMFRYRNWSLYAVADYRTGHVFFNDIVNALEFAGLTKHSATAGRQPFVFPNSSYNTGTASNPVYVANTNRLVEGGGNAFWDAYGTVKENYVTDATTLKLREVSLKYAFDSKILDQLGVDGLELSLFGRNLMTWRPKDNVYTDPEFNFTTGNAVGVGTQSQTAPTRQFGMSLNVTF